MRAASVGDMFIWTCCWPAERTDRSRSWRVFEVHVWTGRFSLLDESSWISFTCLSVTRAPPSIVAFALWLVLHLCLAETPLSLLKTSVIDDSYSRARLCRDATSSLRGRSSSCGWTLLTSLCQCWIWLMNLGFTSGIIGHCDAEVPFWLRSWWYLSVGGDYRGCSIYMWVEFPLALMTNMIICFLVIEVLSRVLIWITDKQHHAVVWLFIITVLFCNRAVVLKERTEKLFCRVLRHVCTEDNKCPPEQYFEKPWRSAGVKQVICVSFTTETLLFLCRSLNSKTVLWGFIRVVMDLCPLFILQYPVFYSNNSYNIVRKSAVLF